MSTASVVNVASVSHYSPFRYPGGKTWFVPHFTSWLASLPERPRTLVEPFAGGAIVGLTAVVERLVDRLIMIEHDTAVAAVWRTIFGARCDWLIERIETFDLTREKVQRELSCKPRTVHRMAFQTILRNRVQRGGIMAAGASLMLNGENGKGLASRWYPTTLANRLRLLKSVSDRVEFRQGDALQQIPRLGEDSSTAFFVDPPYTAGGKRAGSRLYTCHTLDHDTLFRQLAGTNGPALLTYDDAPEVRALAQKWKFEVRPIPMKNTHHAIVNELAISKTGHGVNRRNLLADKLRNECFEPTLFA